MSYKSEGVDDFVPKNSSTDSFVCACVWVLFIVKKLKFAFTTPQVLLLKKFIIIKDNVFLNLQSTVVILHICDVIPLKILMKYIKKQTIITLFVYLNYMSSKDVFLSKPMQWFCYFFSSHFVIESDLKIRNTIKELFA